MNKLEPGGSKAGATEEMPQSGIVYTVELVVKGGLGSDEFMLRNPETGGFVRVPSSAFSERFGDNTPSHVVFSAHENNWKRTGNPDPVALSESHLPSSPDRSSIAGKLLWLIGLGRG